MKFDIKTIRAVKDGLVDCMLTERLSCDRCKYSLPGCAVKDAVILVNEKFEPEKPMLVWGDGLTNWLICGACRHPIDPGDKFCRECGKAVEQYEPRH